MQDLGSHACPWRSLHKPGYLRVASLLLPPPHDVRQPVLAGSTLLPAGTQATSPAQATPCCFACIWTLRPDEILSLQESGRRAGTENVLLAAALGVAAGIVSEELESTQQHMRGLRDSLQHQLLQHFGKVGKDRFGGVPLHVSGRVLKVGCLQPDRTEYDMYGGWQGLGSWQVRLGNTSARRQDSCGSCGVGYGALHQPSLRVDA